MKFLISHICKNEQCDHVFEYKDKTEYVSLFSYMCNSLTALYDGNKEVICPACKTVLQRHDQVKFQDDQSLVNAYFAYFEGFTGLKPGLPVHIKIDGIEIAGGIVDTNIFTGDGNIFS